MFRLQTAIAASGFLLAFTAAIGQNLDTGPSKSDEYKGATQACGPGPARTQQCEKNATAAEDSWSMGCERLKDQAQRECVLEAFIQQHDRMIRGGSKRE